MPASPAEKPRLAFIDHIRVFLTLVVIMHHAAITYGAPGGWFYKEVQTEVLAAGEMMFFITLMTIEQAYFMGFFFLISGYFTPKSLERKGTARFIGDRFLRLGLPLLAFALILGPVTVAMAETLRGGSFFGCIGWLIENHVYLPGPLWFVQTLILFSLIYIWIQKLIPSFGTGRGEAPLPSHLSLLISAVLTGVFAFALRLLMPVGQDIWGMQIGYFATYIVLFFVGCHAAKHDWLLRVEASKALVWAIVALVAIATIPVLILSKPDFSKIGGGLNPLAAFYAMWEPFVAWGIILAMLYLGRRYLNRTNVFFASLARGSFAAFCIHAPALVFVSMLAKGLALPPVAKWLVVGPASCILSFALAAILVRLPGLKRIL
jgi:hypothetical protein